MTSNLDIVAFIAWVAIFAAPTDVFGASGSILGLLLLPLAWIIRVNLREHWWRPKDRPDG